MIFVQPQSTNNIRLKKKHWNKIITRKYKLFKLYYLFYEETEQMPTGSLYLYNLQLRKKDFLFRYFQNFKSFISLNTFLAKTLKIFFFYQDFKEIYYSFAAIRNRYVFTFNQFKNKLLFNLFNFFYFYNYFYIQTSIEIFYFTKQFKTIDIDNIYKIIYSFKNKKIFLNLFHPIKKNFISISPGMFIKFYEKKKSFRKNKTIKLLMAKYLRKILIITKIKNATILFKKNPIFLIEILTFLNQPVPHKFLNPLNNKYVTDKEEKKPFCNFLYFIFNKNKTYTKNKLKKRGRIKRKILRKLVLENQVID